VKVATMWLLMLFYSSSTWELHATAVWSSRSLLRIKLPWQKLNQMRLLWVAQLKALKKLRSLSLAFQWGTISHSKLLSTSHPTSQWVEKLARLRFRRLLLFSPIMLKSKDFQSTRQSHLGTWSTKQEMTWVSPLTSTSSLMSLTRCSSVEDTMSPRVASLTSMVWKFHAMTTFSLAFQRITLLCLG